MYFLNGDRQYIKPEKACGTLDEQLLNCILQLKIKNKNKEVFKLNFFVDTVSDEMYNELKLKIEKKVSQELSPEIIVNLIAQPPLTCKIIVEVFWCDPVLWTSEFNQYETGATCLFHRENTHVFIGSVQSNEKNGCLSNAQKVFDTIDELFKMNNFPVNLIVRQWNYLEDIIGFDGEKQKYQEFNNVRSIFYQHHFNETGFPAATGIGMNRGGIIIEFVAIKSDVVISKPVDNPEQIAAHNYSKNVLVGNGCVLKTTPKFERARFMEMFDKKLIFISGTASIVGEKTVGIDNAAEQTKVTIQNIQRLYSADVLAQISKKELMAKYGHARVYIKNRKDFPIIKKTFKTYFGKLPVVYILADICRPNLLVEIEGKVILK